ncbi:MAG: hypothetical protein ABFD46_00795 [Armatimonadota bacterium]
MKKSAVQSIIVALIVAVSGSICMADSLWDYEAVDSTGFGTHPAISYPETDPASKIVVEGVALAGSNEILDPALQYTVFIQDDTSDRGGIQAWSGKFLYGDTMWAQLRTTDYIDFAAGDRLRITGLLADMGRGKVVINNRGHGGAPYLIWHVDVIGHAGLPDPELIPTVANCNYFDSMRADGGERYQTRYTMLHGVQISGGAWGSGNLLTINDGTGSVGMYLSAQGDFSSHSQPNGKLNVVGIFDQEDDNVSPYTDGYRIWVKRFSDIAIALSGCREVSSRRTGERVALVNKVVSRVYDGCFFIQDPERAGGVRIISNRTFNPGDVVCVQGLVDSVNDENGISPTYLSLNTNAQISTDAPKPVFVTSPTLWGERGLDVNGLLVRVFVKVGIDQGNGTYSLTDDDSKTVYVKTNGVEMPAPGTNAIITAIATKSGGIPLLLLANKQDIQFITP